MLNKTNQLGQLTELWCQIHFCERGYILSQPTNPSSRYDFIVEIENKLYRIQCKTAHPETNNRISFRVMSKNWNSGELKNYLEDVDYFYTCWNQQGYLLPISYCSSTNREKFLRLGEETDYSIKNDNALYAKDFEIDKILLNLTNKDIHIQKIEDENRLVKKNEINSNICIDCGKIITS